MRRIILAAAALASVVLVTALYAGETKPARGGEESFREHCAVCHPEGGNIINPEKTLRRADREKHGIMTREDIIEKMRHPGKGMTSWSAATIPDSVAGEIADYILATFK